MNIETRSIARKRAWQTDFDLNQSSSPTVPRQGKYRKQHNIMANNDNRNPNQCEFMDLSGTINTGSRGQGPTTSNQVQNSTSSSGRVNNSSRNENLDPSVRDLVSGEVLIIQKTLEDKVKKMVRDEIIDLKKMMGNLTATVQELAKNNSNNIQVQNNTQSRTNGGENRNNDNSQVGSINDISNISDGNASMANENIRPNLPDTRSGIRGNMSTDHPVVQSCGVDFGNRIDRSNPSQKEYCNLTNRNKEVEPLRIRIDKFGLNFNGNTRQMNVDTFIFRLEHLQSQYNIPWGEVLRDFHVLVSGQAEEWFWLGVETQQFSDWPCLRYALPSRYQNTRTNCEIMRYLVERKQQHKESVYAYFHSMCQIRATLIQPISEYDMIRILKRNIKENIARIVYPIMISSVEQLRVECNEAEKMFPKRDFRNIPPARNFRQVNEIYSDEHFYNGEEEKESATYEEIEAIRVNPMHPRQPLTCWNCRSVGHGFMDCPSPQRNLFCYRCGKPDVTAPACPTCKENRKGGAGNTGALRPTDNPAT